MLNFIVTPVSVAIFMEGEHHQIHQGEKGFEEVVKLLTEHRENTDKEVLRELLRTRSAKVAEELKKEKLTDKLQLEGSVLYYVLGPIRYEVNHAITELILGMRDKGFPIKSYLAFIERAMRNPDKVARDGICAFITKGKLPLTEDGHFLAYKAVRKDWKDIHSGTFDNSVGESPEMLRSEVDSDPNKTCSRGLHVCSYGYLPHFRHADGHVVVVKVDPKDACAVPPDYNDTKMRVCKYQVVDVNRTFYEEHPECILSKAVFYSDKEYILQYAHNDDEAKEVIIGYNELDAAQEAFKKFAPKYFRVELIQRVKTEEVQDSGEVSEPAVKNVLLQVSEIESLRIVPKKYKVQIKRAKGEGWETVFKTKDLLDAQAYFDDVMDEHFKVRLIDSDGEVLDKAKDSDRAI